MGNMATENAAGNRIEQLLDAGSVLKWRAVQPEQTDFNMQKRKTRRRCHYRLWSD